MQQRRCRRWAPKAIAILPRCCKWTGALVTARATDLCGSWGNKVDLVRTSAAWDQLLRIATEEGLMGIGYERAQWGEFARVYQFAKIYMFAGACAVADCPLAMTNGAAKVTRSSTTDTHTYTPPLTSLHSWPTKPMPKRANAALHDSRRVIRPSP